MAFDLNDEELKATREMNGADKKLTKKEIQEKINNIKPDKYIYQRYEGIIRKFRDDGEYYIECKTGLPSHKEGTVFLGKTSKNIIDLIEVGDYVNGHLVFDKAPDCLYMEDIDNKMAHIPIIEEDIKTIVTKEQFNSIAYRLEVERCVNIV